MAKLSAGILVYRFRNEVLEVLLVHPGGPLWAKKDTAAWSIPKGEFRDGEDPFQAARREVHEETGLWIREAPMDLGVLTQPGGKKVHAFAVEGDLDPLDIMQRGGTMQVEVAAQLSLAYYIDFIHVKVNPVSCRNAALSKTGFNRVNRAPGTLNL